ncbi:MULTISPECIES: hypothetical protein [Empedobacter]|nr:MULTISPECIES: hypothetical protein [Empedobacter]MDM1042132.1 hypothetical protein [Empedobacter brevis]
MSDKEWAERFNDWVYVHSLKLKLQIEPQELAILKALSKAFSKKQNE